MSTKHINTGADLVKLGASVKVECRSCGAAKSLSGTEMVEACGAGNLKAIERRLVCSKCGAKEASITILPPI
jgi:DNA-directed RNA polymerase subunit M/transcription elongation factor TFIIS